MEQIKQTLIERAINKYGVIKPCGEKKSIDDCFTIHSNQILFWFNDEMDSTKVLMHEFT
jgi:hypothetical protein